MTLYFVIGVILSFAAILGAHTHKRPEHAKWQPLPYALATLFLWPLVLCRELYIIHRYLSKRSKT